MRRQNAEPLGPGVPSAKGRRLHEKGLTVLVLLAFLVAIVMLDPAAVGVSAHPIDKTIVLEGTIITPDTVIRDGRVVVRGDKIIAMGVGAAVPADSVTIKTNGLIYPGLIDLHNHMNWNIFRMWTPPQFFNNRYEWRSSEEYLKTYARWNGELTAVNCERNKYAELKALVGGVTAMQGAFASQDCIKGLVRNLDQYSGLYGLDLGKEKLVHILDIDSLSPDSAKDYRDRLAAKKITSLILHLAEGRRGDRESQNEFTLLAGFGLLTEATAIIHGTGLDDAAMELMGRKKAKLIWSPRSNIVLYGETADIRSALRHKVLVALAPDWSVTGSDNMLDELKVARIWLGDDRDDGAQNKDLVFMVTANPAAIAGLADKLGRIQPGYLADLLVIRGDVQRPYGALVDAKVGDVQLVMIGGQPYYGDPSIMNALGQGQDSEDFNACHARKLLHLTYHNPAETPLNIALQELLMRLTTAMSRLADPKPELAPFFVCR